VFLTTNRVQVFDEAILSRIHISLHYPDLTVDAKKHVWRNFLKRNYPEQISDMQMEDLAKRSDNGRQIKNVVRTAEVLARSRQKEIDYNLLVEVLQLAKDGYVTDNFAPSVAALILGDVG
jgi:SpoVK/Ycf46/Vps4 family AAA+-type ATPase